MLSIFEPIQRTWNIWQQPPKLNEDGLETITEYRQRRTSIHVVNFTYFLRILGYTIITPGVWPYLDKVSVALAPHMKYPKLNFLFYFLQLLKARPRCRQSILGLCSGCKSFGSNAV